MSYALRVIAIIATVAKQERVRISERGVAEDSAAVEVLLGIAAVADAVGVSRSRCGSLGRTALARAVLRCQKAVTTISPYRHDVKHFLLSAVLARCMISVMNERDLIKKIRSDFARQGGLARAKAMTAEERRKSATKASRAAARARIAAARAKARKPGA